MDKLFANVLRGSIEAQDSAPTLLCPDEDTLAGFMAESLGFEQMQSLQRHMWNCRYCLIRLSDAYEAQKRLGEGGFAPANEKLIKRACEIARHTKPAVRAGALSHKRHLWLVAAAVTFALSFVFRQYFMQFLVVTLILGIKWAIESKNFRTLIMVIDQWRRHSYDKDADSTSDRRNISGNVPNMRDTA